MTDEELRAAYARAVERRGTDGRDGCPPLEALASLVERRGGEATRLATLDHAMACGAGCAAELELLRSLRGAAQAVEPAASAAGVTSLVAWRGRWALPAVAAAGLLVAVGVVAKGRARTGGAAESGVVRGGESSSISLVGPADGAPVNGTVRLVWHAVPGARAYTVEVLEGAGHRATSSVVTADTALAWRPDSGAAAGDYRWWVRTTDVDGIAHESPMQRLRVAGPTP